MGRAMRYLAIDYGAKRTGLAICDAAETIASPLDVVQGEAEVLKRIAEVVGGEKVEAVVLGLPLNMDGSEGPQARLVRKFAERLRREIDVPVHFQDERLSSFTAGEKLTVAEFAPEERRKRLDAVAAAQILEDFLEAKRAE